MKLLAGLIALFAIAGAGTASVGTAASARPAGEAWVGDVGGVSVDAMLPPGYDNPRSAEQAVQWALSQVGVIRDVGHCLRFVDLAFGRGSGPASAYQVWSGAPVSLRRSAGSPPRGAVVVWSSAIGRGHGHIAVSLGDGRMVSTTDGPVSVLPIQGFADSAYLGWMPPYFYM